MNIFYKILFVTFGCFLAIAVNAQAVKYIEISHNRSYTDHISLQKDASDKDLMVKFVFDEPQNQLTVSLISYRSLFVFQENTYYKQVVKRGKLKPEKIPYVVEFEKGTVYKLTKELRKSIDHPKKRFVFKGWIEYERLQPLPTEYRMNNDYISQAFHVIHKDTMASITLHNILLMDESGKSRPLKKRYDLTFMKNLNRMYHITIKRNPCFGKEEEIGFSQKALEGVKQAYHSITQRFKPGIKQDSREKANLFYQMKGLILKQYMPHTGKYTCEAIQDNWNSYNCYIDSISKQECHYESKQVEEAAGSSEVSTSILLEKARLLDKTVSQWLLSNDKAERNDLNARCKSIITEMNKMMHQLHAASPNQRAAITICQKAFSYYRTNCTSIKNENEK
ncbi:MAG: hypothetical protein RR331_01795 [Bacteroides sp.]